MTSAATYAEFAAREANGVSYTYERLARAVSRDAELLALLEPLPPGKLTRPTVGRPWRRQPPRAPASWGRTLARTSDASG